ncbi:hypothetical protein ACQKK2_00615 [Bacillus paranthracis]|uniref:Uncharacterized protein n=1 Tax=Bacillus cereus (strain Q1) TaxID=361100 RepID=B9IZ97_BACCQ|nr:MULTISPECIES: hypothetical protein [Bacillus cereus group]ACM14736.1 hypothetical protein BCQ_4310 [Bacillus cereus Q1]MBY5227581.1 hypothetical protein [Bacillus paranthracis]MCY9249725.1 hypothetical protein [Bacillus paranthracis]MDA1499627.1 hypothetical protein [Bacillus cereus group sp. TH41-1LC]MDA1661224.1 hypothetical protein [Bacillus cereus group sp. TH153LC]
MVCIKTCEELFKEKREYILSQLKNKISLSVEVEQMFNLLKRVPSPQSNTYPLTDESQESLLICDHESKVKRELINLLAIQTDYEFRNISKIPEKIKDNKLEITRGLYTVVKDLMEIRDHINQPDMSEVLETIKQEQDAINRVFNKYTLLIEEWIKNQEKRSS